jgi:carboxypeptidase C (cathepsin A)
MTGGPGCSSELAVFYENGRVIVSLAGVSDFGYVAYCCTQLNTVF